MTLPSRSKMRKPILECAAQHNQSLHRSFFYDYLANDYFKLTEEQKEHYSSAGNGPIFTKNFDGALSHLVRDGLLERTEKAHYRITEQGKLSLSNPTSLEESEECSDEQKTHSEEDSDKQKIYDEILETILKKSPYELEDIVGELFRKMGYDSIVVTPKSNDQGIDVEIEEDDLGLNRIHIQVKRYTTKIVGRPEIQQFAGALRSIKSYQGIFITTSRFAKPAETTAREYPDARIVLIDGKQLAKLIYDHKLDI